MMLKIALQSMFIIKQKCKEVISTYAYCNNYPGKSTCQKKKKERKDWKETHENTHIPLSECELYGQYIFSCFQFVCNGVILIASNNDKPIN